MDQDIEKNVADNHLSTSLIDQIGINSNDSIFVENPINEFELSRNSEPKLTVNNLTKNTYLIKKNSNMSPTSNVNVASSPNGIKYTKRSCMDILEEFSLRNRSLKEFKILLFLTLLFNIFALLAESTSDFYTSDYNTLSTATTAFNVLAIIALIFIFANCIIFVRLIRKPTTYSAFLAFIIILILGKHRLPLT